MSEETSSWIIQNTHLIPTHPVVSFFISNLFESSLSLYFEETFIDAGCTKIFIPGIYNKFFSNNPSNPFDSPSRYGGEKGFVESIPGVRTPRRFAIFIVNN